MIKFALNPYMSRKEVTQGISKGWLKVIGKRKARSMTLYTLPIYELERGVKLGDTFG